MKKIVYYSDGATKEVTNLSKAKRKRLVKQYCQFNLDIFDFWPRYNFTHDFPEATQWAECKKQGWTV